MNSVGLSLKERIQSAAANGSILWGVFVLYIANPYYRDFLLSETKAILFWSVVLYSLWLVLSLFIGKPTEKSKGLIILSGVSRFVRGFFHYSSSLGKDSRAPFPQFTSEERTALLFLAVKVFFLPIMINFVVGNFGGFSRTFSEFSFTQFFEAKHFITVVYPLLLSFIFLIDTFFLLSGTWWNQKN